MTAALISISDDLADYLAARLGTPVIREYTPSVKLKKLGDMRISVIPGVPERSTVSRRHVKCIYPVSVAVMRKIASDMEIDDLVAICHRILGYSQKLSFLVDNINFICVTAEYDPPFSPEYLEQQRQFFGLVTLKFVGYTDD